MVDARNIADEVLGDIGVRLGVKAVKARGSYENVTEDPVQVVDITGAVDVDSEGFKATLLAPTSYANDPELFYGPFLQVGSYFKLGPDWMQFALDSVLDPLNFVPLGTGGLLAKVGIRGLTKAGRRASLMSTLAKVSQAKKASSAGAISGKAIVDEAIAALETAGRLISLGGDELVRAAKAGDKSLKATLRRAAKLAPDDETRRLLEALRKDRDVLGDILDKADELEQITKLPDTAFLQESYLGRTRGGQARQANPLVGIVKPANPFKNPLLFTRQLVGFAYGDDEIIAPGSMLVSEGLDRVLGKLPGAALPEGVADVGRGEIAAFKARAFQPGDTTVAHVAFAVQAMTAVVGAPGAPLLRALGHGAIDEDGLRKVWNGFMGFAEDHVPDADDARWLKFNDSLARNLNAKRLTADKKNNAARNDAIEAAIAVSHAYGEAHGLDDALIAGHDSAIRRFADMFSADSLMFDAISPGNAMAARVSAGNLMSHTIATNMRDVLRRVVPAKRFLGIPVGRGPQDQIAEVIPRLIDAPDLWDISDTSGRAVLKRGMLEKILTPDIESSISPLLRKTLNDAGGGASDLARHLLDEGLHPELVEMSKLMKGSLDAIGPNLLGEGVVRKLTEDYFTRVFRPNEKFWSQYKGGPTVTGNQFISKLFKLEDDALLGQLAKAEIGTQELVRAAREGKATPLQVRRWTEAAAVRAEELGFGELRMDGIEAFGNYLADVNGALLMQRVRRELTHSSPRLTRSIVRMVYGDEVADRLSDEMFKYGRVHEGDLPSELRSGDNPLYRRLIDRPSVGGDDMDVRIANEALRRTLVGTARRDGSSLAAERVGRSLDGATEINGFKLVDADGNPVAFRESWVTDGVPEGVVGEKKVRAFIQHDIRAAEIEQSIVDAIVSEWSARELKYGKAADALSARAAATRKAARSEATLAVAVKVDGAKSFNGITIFDEAGKAVPLDGSWVLDGRVPKGYTGKVKGKSLTAAGVRRELKAMVDAEALSKDIEAAIGRRVSKLESSAAVMEAKAEAKRILGAAAHEEAAAHVAKRFPKAKFKGRVIRDSVTGEPVRLREEWIRDPSKLPKTLVARREIRDTIRQQIRSGVADRLVRKKLRVARTSIQKAAQFMPLDDAAKKSRGELWVFAPDFRRMQDAFRIYSQEGVTSKFWRTYDRATHALKGVVLAGDIFHYNVLATSQFAALSTLNPRVMLDAFRDESGALLPGVARAAFRAGVGGAAGGLAGAGLSDDGGDIATFSLAGAIYGALVGGATANARYARNLALNPQHLDTIRWMGIGGWTGRPDDRSIGVAQRGLKRIERALRDTPALRNPVTGARHVLDAWDDQLWGVMHNGSKHFYFDVTWRREVQRLEDSVQFGESFLRAQHENLKAGRAVDKAIPTMAEDAELTTAQFIRATRQRMKQGLAREIVQVSNNAFGGQAMSALMENPEWQRNLRRVLLAPDWTGSQLAMTASMFANLTKGQQAGLGALIGTGVELAEMGFDPEEHGPPVRGVAFGAALGLGLGRWMSNIQRRLFTPGDVMAKEARRMTAAALIGGYTFINLANKAFTGRWAFENEDGHETSIELPGLTDSGRKRYVKLGKPWMEAWEFAGVSHKDKYPIPVAGRLRSKLAVVPNGILSVLDNRGVFGPIITGDDGVSETAVKAVNFAVGMTTPIVTQGPLRALASGFEAGETAAGAIRLSGFQVSTGRERARLPILGEAIRPPGLSDAPFEAGF